MSIYNVIQNGWDTFDHYIIQDNLTKKEADLLETLNIEVYNTTNPDYGYNLCTGGSNGKLSEEALNRLRVERTPLIRQPLMKSKRKSVLVQAKPRLVFGYIKEVQVKPEYLEKLNDGYVKGRYYPNGFKWCYQNDK